MRKRRRGRMRRRRRRRKKGWVPDGRAGCLGKVLVAVALWPWRAGGGTDVRTFVCSDGRTDGRKLSPVFYRHRPLRVRCPKGETKHIINNMNHYPRVGPESGD